MAAALAFALLLQAAVAAWALWHAAAPNDGTAAVLLALGLLGLGLLALLGGCAVRDWWVPLHSTSLAIEALARGDAPAEPAQPVPGVSTLHRRLAELTRALDSRDERVEAIGRELAEQQSLNGGRSELHDSHLTKVAQNLGQMGGTLAAAQSAAGQAEAATASMVETAVGGCEAIATVLATMAEIQDSSRKITEIIGVVDAIAFQTNILALNAAVESARAGEQGRGFAVVAGEVRQLATRSAVAAKEIKGLVGKSAERIDAGSVHIVRARESMENLLDCLSSVSTLIGEVSGATRQGDAYVRDITGVLGALHGAPRP